MVRRAQRERISLPWERHGRPWRTATGGGGGKLILGAILALTVTWALIRHTNQRVRVRDTEIAIAQVRGAIERFRLDMGRCPTSNAELVHPPKAQKHYLEALPLDGWGRPLEVRCPGTFGDEPDVISAGPSGSFLTDDNIP